MYDICVVGFGAIGTLYSLVLERSGKARVTAVCRSNYRVVVDHGVDIVSDKFGQESAWRPYRVVSTPEEAADRDYEFIVCCFKALPDIIPTPALIQPLLNKSKAFVLLQNGIGIESDLQEASPHATIISGCCWIDTTAVDNGRKVLHSSLEILTLGYHRSQALHETNQLALDRFVELLRQGNSTPEPTSNIDAERWRKILWNASFSTLCTLSRAPVSDLLRKDVISSTMPVIRGLMTEVIRVARAAGIDNNELPDAAVDKTIELTVEKYGEDPTGVKQPEYFKPSMTVDLDARRPMEVEVIVGGIIRRARKLDVPTPQLDLVYASLRVLQLAILEDVPRVRSGPV
ncbi:2-dehydropantoate 2-reductase [Rickenella mellea]|uniref:2-dehydropantoate 2-reductase n=1 Tax=Rickenella mellea TaxID=50990 RepID=A0A4R5XEE9_9AGAM|nr:2-dehydropantoate 2-reductase [Rickenella mellea]